MTLHNYICIRNSLFQSIIENRNDVGNFDQKKKINGIREKKPNENHQLMCTTQPININDDEKKKMRRRTHEIL